MTIFELYLQLAKRGLNVSLFFCGLAVIGILLALKIPFPIAILPFLFLSICYFMIHLYYWQRAKKLAPLPLTGSFPNNHYLIENFDPNYFFFLPNGLLYQKITSQKAYSGRKMIFQSKDGESIYLLLRKNRNEYIIIQNEQVVLRILIEDKSLQELPANEKTIIVRKNGGSGVYFFKKNHLIGQLQKGWMPLDWIHLFRLNTPVLTFLEPLPQNEKIALFLITTIFV